MWRDGRTDKNVLQWFGCKRMKSNRIAERIYEGERMGSRPVGKPRNDGLTQ